MEGVSRETSVTSSSGKNDHEPTRLDAFRGGVARALRERLAEADDDRELGEALDRWELSLFQEAPFRAEQLRSALESLLGAEDGQWAATLRVAVLLGEAGRERKECLNTLRGGDPGDLVRRALVETITRGDRAGLIAELDEALLGIRPRPTRLEALAS